MVSPPSLSGPSHSRLPPLPLLPQEFDQVAINSIWREHIKKENAILKLNDQFRLNPKQLTANMITGKPNVDPARIGNKLEADPEMIAELDDILKNTKKVPTEKYEEPMTTSQQIGWFSKPLVIAPPSINPFIHSSIHPLFRPPPPSLPHPFPAPHKIPHLSPSPPRSNLIIRHHALIMRRLTPSPLTDSLLLLFRCPTGASLGSRAARSPSTPTTTPWPWAEIPLLARIRS